MESKFDIWYLLAKESMAFKKHPASCRLAERHGVELGNAYRTKFNYIAQHWRNNFMDTLSKPHFFSLLMKSYTNAGSVEDKIFVVLHCCKNDKSKEIQSYGRFFQYKFPRKLTLMV